ncbi:D-alanyl-D-alanine carboxypeptidase / D-alanyl-D-alanine-endopeptidase (penicillin-binding protein 4) [Parelusimicrobium proximum]|uniref:D-alanyl-D-alanine carboxypeptidase/D-alanyl-D-alanine endopeptidase n=1 Tax=Parelusimicrobium proximum TaxID=3228953 RepID=UPI003D165893
MKKILTAFIMLSLSFVCSHGQEIFTPSAWPALTNTSYSFYAKYINGPEIIAINKSLRLTPASIQKLYITAAALDAFGPDKRFETVIYYDGKISASGTLKGNIYIKGGGDPSLGAGNIEGNMTLAELMSSWAQQISEKGIKKINGNIYADASLFEGPNIPEKSVWEDMGNYFGASSDALTINENMFRVTLKDGSTDAASISPEVPGIKIINLLSITDDPDKSGWGAYSAPYQMEYFLEGEKNIAKKNDYSDLAIPNPPLFTAQTLKKYLADAGIKVSGNTLEINIQKSADKQILFTHYSPPLSAITNRLNKRSVNIYAEILLKHLALHYGMKGSTKDGVKALGLFLTSNGLSVEDFKVYDGSGLSRYNIITAEQSVKLLELASAQNYYSVFTDSLVNFDYFPQMSKGAYYNTLSLLDPACDIKIKTGFLSGVRTYAGYIKDKKGRSIAFTFMVNNYTDKTTEINKTMDNILIHLSNLK